MLEIKCAYCDKSFQIKPYLKKEHNFCCKEHYYMYEKEFCSNKIMTKCDFCGKIFEYRDSPSHFNRSTHHYCSNHCQCEANRVYPEYHSKKNPKYHIWQEAKRRARRKRIDFNIELEDLPPIPDVCPILGIPLKSNTNSFGPCDNSPSIDRIDNSKGYIKDNVIIISYKANRMKSNATIEELRRFADFYENLQSDGK